MALSKNSAGWYDFPLHGDARNVYVDSGSGNDSNDGLSEGQAKATISAGIGVLRDGYGDHLLIKRGTTYTAGFGIGTSMSGLSEDYPTVISVYGSGDLPIIYEAGITCLGGLGGNPSYRCQNLAIEHLRVYQRTTDGVSFATTVDASCMNFLSAVNNLTIQGMDLRWGSNGAIIQSVDGTFNNVVWHRNVIQDIYATGTNHSQGLFAQGITGLTLSESFWDQCGSADIANTGNTGATIFRHCIYVQTDCTNVNVTGCFSSKSGSTGYSLRNMEGGTVQNCIAYRTPISFGMLIADSGGGVMTATENVVIDGADIGAGNPRGWGMEMQRANGASAMTNNLVIGTRQTGGQPNGLLVYGSNSSIDITGNVVWNWGGQSMVRGSDHLLSNNTFVETSDNGVPIILHDASDDIVSGSTGNTFYPHDSDTDFQINNVGGSFATWESTMGVTGNTLAGAEPTFTDTTRDLGTYAQTVLGLTNDPDDYRDAVRALNVDTWDDRLLPKHVINWIGAGWDMDIGEEYGGGFESPGGTPASPADTPYSTPGGSEGTPSTPYSTPSSGQLAMQTGVHSGMAWYHDNATVVPKFNVWTAAFYYKQEATNNDWHSILRSVPVGGGAILQLWRWESNSKWNLNLNVGGDNHSPSDVYSNVGGEVGEWVHIGIVVDNSQARFYIDGTLTVTNDTSLSPFYDQDLDYVRINSTGAVTNYGNVRNLTIYNGALTAEELTQTMYEVPPSSIGGHAQIGYFNGDGTPNDAWTDLSGNGADVPVGEQSGTLVYVDASDLVFASAPNASPTANAGADQDTSPGQLVQLKGAASDSDGDDVTYVWTQVSGTTVTLSSPDILSPTFEAPTTPQNVVFNLAVSDGNITTEDQVTITVPNLTPSADAGNNQSAFGGRNVTLDATSSSDPNGQSLTYTWVQTGGTTVGLNSADTARPTFVAPDIDDTLTFKVTVSDGAQSSFSTVDVNTMPSNLSLPSGPPDLRAHGLHRDHVRSRANLARNESRAVRLSVQSGTLQTAIKKFGMPTPPRTQGRGNVPKNVESALRQSGQVSRISKSIKNRLGKKKG